MVVPLLDEELSNSDQTNYDYPRMSTEFPNGF
jgi:hypothetical protein